MKTVGLQITGTEWGAHLEVTDSIRIEDVAVQQELKNMISQLRKTGKMRILVNRQNITVSKSILALYEELELFVKIGGFGFRIAFVAPDLVKTNHSQFVENAGFNRSILIKYFRDSQTAIEWLKANKL